MSPRFPTDEEKKQAYEHRPRKAVSDLSKAFALSVPHDKALEIRDEVGFFQAVRAALAKSTGEKQKSPEQIDAAIRQIISRAVVKSQVDVRIAAHAPEDRLFWNGDRAARREKHDVHLRDN